MTVKLDIKIEGAEKADSDFKKLETTGDKLDSSTKNLISTTRRYTEELEKNNTVVQTIEKTNTAQLRSLKKYEDELSKVEKKMGVFRDGQGRLRENNGRFVQEGTELADTLKKQGIELNKAVASTEKMGSSIAAVEEKSTKLNTTINGLTTSISKVTSFTKGMINVFHDVVVLYDLLTDTAKLEKLQGNLFLLSRTLSLIGRSRAAGAMKNIAVSMEPMILLSEKINEFSEMDDMGKTIFILKALYGDAAIEAATYTAALGGVGYATYKTGKQIANTGSFLSAYTNAVTDSRIAITRFKKDLKGVFPAVSSPKTPLVPSLAGGFEKAKNNLDVIGKQYKKTSIMAANEAKKIGKVFNLSELENARNNIEEISKSFRKSSLMTIDEVKNLGKSFKLSDFTNIMKKNVDGVYKKVEETTRKIPDEYRYAFTSAGKLVKVTSVELKNVFQDTFVGGTRSIEKFSGKLRLAHTDFLVLKRSTVDTFSAMKTGLSTTKGMLKTLFTHSSGVGFISLAEQAKFLSASLTGVSFAFLSADNAAARFLGAATLLIATLTAGFGTLAGIILSKIGDALIYVGKKLFTLSSRMSEIFRRFEKGAFTFSFTFKGIRREVGDSLGTLEEWTSFVEEMDATTNKTRDDIQRATAEMLLQGKALGFTQGQMENLIKRTADLSEITGDSLFDAMISVLGGIQGNSMALMKYGLHLNESGIKHSDYVKKNKILYDQLSDNERAMVAMNVLMEQSSVIQGKATQTTQTMSAVYARLDKRLEFLQARLGEQASLVRKIYVWLGDFVGMLSNMPQIFIDITGSLIDVGGVILTVLGYFIKFIMYITLITTLIAVLKIALTGLNTVLATNITVQKAVAVVTGWVSKTLGINTVAVTSNATAWLFIRQTLTAVFIQTLAGIGAMFKSMAVSIWASTKALYAFLTVLNNRLAVYRVASVVTAFIGLYLAIKQTMKAGEPLSDMFRSIDQAIFGVDKGIDELSDSSLMLQAIWETIKDSFLAVGKLILNGILTISLAIVTTLKNIYRFIVKFVMDTAKVISVTIGVFSDAMEEKFVESMLVFENFDENVDKSMESIRQSMILAIGRIGSSFADMFSMSAYAAEGINNNFTRSIYKAASATDSLRERIIRAEVSGKDYTRTLLEVKEAINEYNKALNDSDVDKEGKEDARLNALKEQLSIIEKLKKETKDNTVDINLRTKILEGDNSKSGIAEKEAIKAEKAIEPLNKKLEDLKEAQSLVGDLFTDDPKVASEQQKHLTAAIKKVQSDIEKIKRIGAIETTRKIADNQKEADKAVNEVVLNNIEKIKSKYDEQIKAFEEKRSDGYITEKKFSELEKKLMEERGRELLKSVTSASKELKDQEKEITSLYDKKLISLEQYNKASTDIESKRLEKISATERKHLESTGNVIDKIKMVGITFNDELSKLDTSLNNKDYFKAFDNIEKGSKGILLKVQKQLKSFVKDGLQQIEDLKEEGIIDDKEAKLKLFELKNSIIETTEEMSYEFNRLFEGTLDQMLELFSKAEDLTESQKRLLEGDIKDIANRIMDLSGDIKIKLTGKGSELGESIDSETRRQRGDSREEDENRRGYTMMYAGMVNNYSQFQKMQNNMEGTTRNIIANIKGGTDSLVDTLFSTNLIDKKVRAEWAATAVEDYTDTLGSWFPSIGKEFKNLNREFTAPFGRSESVWDRIKSSIGQIGNTFSTVLAPVTKTITTAWLNLFAQQGWMADTIKFFGQSEKAITEIMYGIRDGFYKLFDNLLNNLPYFFSVMGDFVGEFIVKVAMWIGSGKLFEAVIEAFYSGIVAALMSFGKAFYTYIIEPVYEKLSSVFDWIKRSLFSMAAIATAAWSVFFLYFKVQWSNASNEIGKILLGGFGFLGSSIPLLFSDMGKKSMSAFLEAFTGVIVTIKNLFLKFWSWLTGVTVRIQKRIDRYNELTRDKDTTDDLMDEHAEGVESYVEKYGSGEFKIKEVTEDDQGRRLGEYAESVKNNLSDTALNFADSVGSKTENSLSQAVLEGMNRGIANFEKVNDFTIKVNLMATNVPKFSSGGFVSGTPKVAGDSEKNDTIPALLSAGEYIIPRSVTRDSEKMKAILAIMGGKEIVRAAGGMYNQQHVNSILAQMQKRGYTQSLKTKNEALVVSESENNTKYASERYDAGDGLFSGLGDVILESFKKVFDKIKTLFMGIPTDIKNAIAGIFVGIPTKISDAISDIDWKKLGDSVKDAIKGAFDGLKEALKGLKKAIKDIAVGGTVSLLGLLGIDEKTLKKLENNKFFNVFMDALSWLITIEISVFAAYVGYLTLETAARYAAIAAHTLYNYIITATTYAVQGATIAWNFLSAGVSNVVVALWQAVTSLWSYFTALMATLAPYLLIAAAIAGVIAVVYVMIQNWNVVKGIFQSLTSYLSRIGSYIWRVISLLYGVFVWIDKVSNVGAVLSNIVVNIGKGLGNFAKWFVTLPKNLILWLSQGIASFSSRIYNVVSGVLSNAVSKIGDAIADLVKKLDPSKGVKKAGGLVKKGWNTVKSWFYEGGWVTADNSSQKAYRGGDNIRNDKIPAFLSEGEFVLPRSITQNTPIMNKIMSIINGDTDVLAPVGYPIYEGIENENFKTGRENKISLDVTENKNITIDVKADKNVSIDGKDFRNILLPEIKRSLYDDSKRGVKILSDRGIEKR